MGIELALADAKRNKHQANACCRLTLKGSGVQYDGKIHGDRDHPATQAGTVMLDLNDGGWVTVEVDEIAAVESHP